MATTVTKSELDQINQQNSTQSTDVTNEEKTYEGKFIGTLIGNATTAKELEKPYNFSLDGDASGTVEVNASSVILPVKVNHATHADTADFAGKTQFSARASVADMANTAEFAYRAGILSSLFIKLSGGVIGSGRVNNSNELEIAVSSVDVGYFFVFNSLPEDVRKADEKKAYVDLDGKHFWIYDNDAGKWKDAYSTLAKALELHEQRFGLIEPQLTTNTDDITTLKSTVSQHGTTLTNHEDRITVNETNIRNYNARITTNASDITALAGRMTAVEKVNDAQTVSLTDHEKRIGNIETTSDVGQIATRVQAIEDKNEQQDTAIANESANRQSKDDELDAKDTALENALKTEKQEREQKDTSIENKNTEQDERLDAIENKNTEQDASIKSNATAINANASSLSGLNSQVTDLKSDVSSLQTDVTTNQNNITTLVEKVSLLAIVPTGTIIPFAGSNIPAGYLLCNGSAVSRTSYANLFEVISTLYGEGDGSTTFNLPDLRDRFLEGAGTNALGTYLEAGLPNIIGTFSSRPRDTADFGGTIVFANGAFTFKDEGDTKNKTYTYKVTTNNILPCDLTTLNANLSSSVYSASKTVQPKSLAVQYLIKY